MPTRTGSSATSSTGSSERLRIGGDELPIAIRVNRRARRIILRCDAGGAVTLVLPSKAHRAEGLRFAAGKAGWIRRRLAQAAARTPFGDGATIPLLGRPHHIRHLPDGTIVGVVDGEIRVGGRADTVERRVAAWLRVEARRLIAARARVHAAALGRPVARVTVRDTRSRWGSCSAAGALSFSWRLVLAPEPVLDYVVAHECAHLVEMNHGPRFWQLVARLQPEFAMHRRWLKEHGATLHRYG